VIFEEKLLLLQSGIQKECLFLLQLKVYQHFAHLQNLVELEKTLYGKLMTELGILFYQIQLILINIKPFLKAPLLSLLDLIVDDIIPLVLGGQPIP